MNRGRGIGGVRRGERRRSRARRGGEAAAASALMSWGCSSEPVDACGAGAIRSTRRVAGPRPLETRIAVGPDDRPKGQTITI
jgi:hypothetical protein